MMLSAFRRGKAYVLVFNRLDHKLYFQYNDMLAKFSPLLRQQSLNLANMIRKTLCSLSYRGHV